MKKLIYIVVSAALLMGQSKSVSTLQAPASSTAQPSLSIPPGSAPTSPASGNLWNLAGVLQYFDGSTTRSIVTTGQTNTYGAFLQDFSAGTIKVGASAGAAPTVSARIDYDTTANLFKGGVNGSTKIFGLLSGAFSDNDCLKYQASTNTIITSGSACGAGGGGSSTNFVLTRNVDNVTYTIAPPASGYVVGTCGNKAVRVTTTAQLVGSGSWAAAGAAAWVTYDCASAAIKVDTNANFTQGNVTLTGATYGSSSATGFPNNAVKIVALTAGNTAINQWDASPTTDWQGNQSTTVVGVGADLTKTLNADGSTTVSLDTTIVPQKFFGAGTPGSVSGNLPNDLYSDTTNHDLYWCAAASGTAAPACTSVSVGGWTKANSAGGAATYVYPSVMVAACDEANNTAYPAVTLWTAGATRICPFNTTSYGAVQLSNSGTAEIRYAAVLPSTFSASTLNFRVWGYDSTTGGSRTLALKAGCTAPAGDILGTSFNSAVSVTQTVTNIGGAYGEWDATFSSVSVTGCSATNNIMFISITRTDTNAGNFFLFAFGGR